MGTWGDGGLRRRVIFFSFFFSPPLDDFWVVDSRGVF